MAYNRLVMFYRIYNTKLNMRSVHTPFIRTPKPGDKVKVYIRDTSTLFGTVDYIEKGIDKKKVNSSHEEIYKLKRKNKYKEARELEQTLYTRDIAVIDKSDVEFELEDVNYFLESHKVIVN